MNNLISIYCQEHDPLNKHCCFGEVYVDSIGDKPIRERYKCEFYKRTGNCSKKKNEFEAALFF